MNKGDFIIVGRFGKVHGIKGYIKIISFTEPFDNLLNYSELYIFLANQWQPVQLSDVEVMDRFLLAKVEGYKEREDVAQLTNVELGILNQQLPELPKGEYYWHQLIGLKVINQQGIILGLITELMETGANDVLVVEGEKKHLIPYLLEQYVLEVNLESQTVRVDWDAEF